MAVSLIVYLPEHLMTDYAVTPLRRFDDLPPPVPPTETPQLDWTALSDTAPPSAVLRHWQRASRSAIGRWLFARIVCRRAPYFATVSPKFLELAPGIARISMKKKRRVENHIGTVHAIAMANLCELAAGTATEVSIPATRRWIPRGMTIEYLKRADTGVTATATLAKKEWNGPTNIAVPVSVTDEKGQEVVRAVITMYVSPRPSDREAG